MHVSFLKGEELLLGRLEAEGPFTHVDESELLHGARYFFIDQYTAALLDAQVESIGRLNRCELCTEDNAKPFGSSSG